MAGLGQDANATAQQAAFSLASVAGGSPAPACTDPTLTVAATAFQQAYNAANMPSTPLGVTGQYDAPTAQALSAYTTAPPAICTALAPLPGTGGLSVVSTTATPQPTNTGMLVVGLLAIAAGLGGIAYLAHARQVGRKR